MSWAKIWQYMISSISSEGGDGVLGVYNVSNLFLMIEIYGMDYKINTSQTLKKKYFLRKTLKLWKLTINYYMIFIILENHQL